MRHSFARALLWGCFLLTSGPPVLAATVSGFVRSASSGEALDFANVFLRGTPYGDMANEKGYYVITGVPAGSYEIAFSFMGYALETQEMVLTEDQELSLSVELTPNPIQMEEFEVKAGESDLLLQTSKVTLRTSELTTIPKVGEADLFRAVQSLPGVATLSDFSSGLYVRGGSADQNLILLDDVDVYNPSHLFGFFSTFNVDAVKTVDLQKSGYPARYGGRLSSLLDVRNRDGNRKEYQGVGRVSLIASSATVEGPWSKGSWMLSGRHTYIEPLARAADVDFPYKFYDVHGKLNYDLARGDHTSVSLFRSRDRLDWDRKTLDLLLDWGNDTGSIQWTHLFNPRLFSHFTVGGSSFTSTGEIAFQDFAFRLRNEVRDWAMKGNLSYTPSADHLIDFGFEGKALDFDFVRAAGEEQELRFAYQGTYAALYGQDSWRLSPRWQIQPGLRLEYYSEGDYFRLGPRLSVRRKINETTAVHATYGRYYQFLNLVSEEGASFADMWFPVDRTLDPGRADHYIFGVDLGPYDAFDLSVEVYYKDYLNLVEFSEEFGRSLIDENATLDEAFDTGNGSAYGGELYLRNHVGGFDGWIGYAYGKSQRTIQGFNYGREYDPQYDRRHAVTIMQSRSLGRGWMLQTNFRYGSGQPTTLAAGRYTVRDITGREYDVALPGEYHGYRLPDFHRLDIGISRAWHPKGLTVEPSLEIINVYNHENVYLRQYDLTKNPAEYEDVTMLPFLPTVGVSVRF
ncbi:MAG: TonB-dependent receptor [Candidatus Eisenbacteria bacterium]|uniref:TonB-dependent receptor n=1 Tax=Eiseniibacteriota bacterium TaxID=2212470 RepID=A0A956RMW9_UNCEI|nr:TonB-dependent receptor [Candidatus Eisenbacteria bacterium]